jgi:hypothetical protein
MRGTHNFVMLPARSVTVLPASVFIGHYPVITGESVYFFLEKQQAIEEKTHYDLPMFVEAIPCGCPCLSFPHSTWERRPRHFAHRLSGAGLIPTLKRL